MDPIDLFTISERIGFPALVIFFLSVAIYKVARWFGAQCEPIFEQFKELLVEHKILIRDVREHLKKNDEFIQNHFKITGGQLAELNDKIGIMTELAQERNAFMKDNVAVFKYINTEIDKSDF